MYSTVYERNTTSKSRCRMRGGCCAQRRKRQELGRETSTQLVREPPPSPWLSSFPPSSITLLSTRMGNHPSKSSPPSAEPASGKTASLSSTTPDTFSKGSQRWKNRFSAGVKDSLGKVDIKRLSRKPSTSKGATSGAASSVDGKEDEGLAKKGAEEVPVQESGPALAANTALAPVPPSSTSTSAATATATPIVIVTEAEKPTPQPKPQQIQLKIPTPPMAPSTVPCQVWGTRAVCLS